MTRPSISAIIITLNEESVIRDCLESVKWVDEIIVIDGGSDDHTREICLEYTDKFIIDTDWQGFGIQKNRALDHASSSWVLSIDSDERVTGSLRREIESSVIDSAYGAYTIPRQSYFMGRAMRHGGWWPDPVLRLFKRDLARFSEDLVHERVLTTTTIGILNSQLDHLSFRKIEQILIKANKYSTASAEQSFTNNRSSNMPTVLLKSFWAFFRAYFIKQGFRDGKEGFIAAIGRAEGCYYKYIKLIYLNEKS